MIREEALPGASTSPAPETAPPGLTPGVPVEPRRLLGALVGARR